ncbi:WD40 repeat protein [Trachipleistophora hominis]|uniref:WD40 repeat protein n=1 Tax=Trachipleistophora hominis TaxID=72359 RepID=L7JZI2_TRAHO|nr:WD40 repeat protein [Trachipleistophora hominis]
MKITERGSAQFDEKLLSLAVTKDSVLTGGTKKILHKLSTDLHTQKILCQHEKSIRCIAAKDGVIVCGSYDGNATVLYEDKILDLIEGPETEIKGVDLLNGNRRDNYIALSTRGKTVWVCKLNDKIEIDSILEDHTQDVKGVKFFNNLLYTYGYDNTVKVYQRFTMYDDSWVLLQSLEAQKETVWDVEMLTKLFVASNDGCIYVYRKEKDWVFDYCCNISVYPILSLCRIRDFLALAVDSKSLVIVDESLQVKCSLEDAHQKDINCVKYSDDNNMLVTCSDDGCLKVYHVDFSE